MRRAREETAADGHKKPTRPPPGLQAAQQERIPPSESEYFVAKFSFDGRTWGEEVDTKDDVYLTVPEGRVVKAWRGDLRIEGGWAEVQLRSGRKGWVPFNVLRQASADEMRGRRWYGGVDGEDLVVGEGDLGEALFGR